MTPIPPPAVEDEADRKPPRRSIVAWLVYALAAVLLAFLTTQITNLENDISTLKDRQFGLEVAHLRGLEKLESRLEAEIDRLDESNRGSRIELQQIAERISAVEAIHVPGQVHE